MKGQIEPGDLCDHRDPRRGFARHRMPVGGSCPRSCILVVKASRLAEQWPTDEAFCRFAAKVADAVQWALANGWKIDPLKTDGSGAEPGCCCPMGALAMRMGGTRAYPWSGLSEAASVFAIGFDKGSCSSTRFSPYEALGCAYRARFVRAESEAA